MSGYVELQLTSHFSFLRGASSAEELFATAALMGMEALAVTDRNSLAGSCARTRRPGAQACTMLLRMLASADANQANGLLT
ncbi:PHP domain-containing protein [Paracoccus rhizosphaerae]|uniref:PHP domain-containing protein n=1 Tax=Paracoccus rhizosphaerae TaxID=1133347 RepID=A0ABV6CPC0_9RHOB|nr:PHP domain-containing protein [Paracoccus rhizosphaerae]